MYNVNSRRILRLKQVMEKVGLGRSSIYLMMKENRFPQSIKLGLGSCGWSEAELDEWLNEKANARK